MEFTPFIFFLIFIIVIYIPAVIYKFKYNIFDNKYNFYIYTILITCCLIYISYLIYKEQDKDRKYAWIISGSTVGAFLICIGVYLVYFSIRK